MSRSDAGSGSRRAGGPGWSTSEGHGRALLGIGKTPEHIDAAAIHVLDAGMTVRETEEYVRGESEPEVAAGVVAPEPEKAPAHVQHSDPNREELEERLQRALGTKVRIRVRKRGGTIQIGFHDADDLDRLVLQLDPPTSRFGELD